jgi:hypothetical protein
MCPQHVASRHIMHSLQICVKASLKVHTPRVIGQHNVKKCGGRGCLGMVSTTNRHKGWSFAKVKSNKRCKTFHHVKNSLPFVTGPFTSLKRYPLTLTPQEEHIISLNLLGEIN